MTYYIQLTILLFLPFCSFSQEKEGRTPKRFEPIFGSGCEIDTLIEDIGKDDQLILYSNELKLVRIKKGRIVKTFDLSEFKKGDEICMMVKTPDRNKQKHKLAMIIVHRPNGEIAEKLFKFPSGKEVPLDQLKNYLKRHSSQ